MNLEQLCLIAATFESEADQRDYGIKRQSLKDQPTAEEAKFCVGYLYDEILPIVSGLGIPEFSMLAHTLYTALEMGVLKITYTNNIHREVMEAFPYADPKQVNSLDSLTPYTLDIVCNRGTEIQHHLFLPRQWFRAFMKSPTGSLPVLIDCLSRVRDNLNFKSNYLEALKANSVKSRLGTLKIVSARSLNPLVEDRAHAYKSLFIYLSSVLAKRKLTELEKREISRYIHDGEFIFPAELEYTGEFDQ